MKNMFLWFLTACFLFGSSLAFAAGKVEEEEMTGLYGGKLTVSIKPQQSTNDPPNPDIAAGQHAPTQWLTPIQETPLVGDFVKYGPRGTGEYEFQLRSFIPDQFLIGGMLESWEVTAEKVVWHVRPGMMWQSVEGVMEAREVTAEDIVADLLYFSEAPGGKGFKKMSGDIYTTDRYTLVIEFSQGFDNSLMYVVGYEDRAKISPPEMVEAGADKWENQVGSGPFMFKEYVVGSHMSYVRNPNYWGKATIDGVEYQLPFVEEMICPIIPDESTRMAALRSGKLDFCELVPPTQWKNLDETAPKLQSSRFAQARGQAIALKCTEPPFDDVEVRRAMMIGTDIKAFHYLEGDEPLPLHWYPVYRGDPGVYTPMEELPEDVQVLYKYDPDMARRMLADAGYPDGFKMFYYTNSLTPYLDRVALIKDQWAKLGVDVEIKVFETVAYEEILSTGTYTHASIDDHEVGNPTRILDIGRSGHFLNSAQWANEEYEQQLALIFNEIDSAERNRIVKEAALTLLKEVPYIPLDPDLQAHFWWPWVENYYGEINVLDQEVAPCYAHIWINQDLKKEMGY